MATKLKTSNTNPGIFFRANPTLRAKLREACALTGMNVSQFIVSTLSREANRVITKARQQS